MTTEASDNPIDHLLDAIELIQKGDREEALPILRQLIRDNKDFEDAWLWMSVAVGNVEQSALCLDNVLRINPRNVQASTALYRLREGEIISETRRGRLRMLRDMALTGFWFLFVGLVFAVFGTYFAR